MAYCQHGSVAATCGDCDGNRPDERECFCAYEPTPAMCPRHGVLP